MKSRTKKILLALVGILMIGIISYKITMRSQNEKLNYEKYGMNFNKNRDEIGLIEISKKWKFNYFIQQDYFDEDFGNIPKLKEVFSFNDIKNAMIYENDSTNKTLLFKSKIILLNSNIMFWKNGIESETDFYERNIDSNTVENLSIRYYFKDDNGNKNYFEANHSIYELDGFYCGTPVIMKREEQRISGKPYFGNITKKQADSILTEWNKKN